MKKRSIIIVAIFAMFFIISNINITLAGDTQERVYGPRLEDNPLYQPSLQKQLYGSILEDNPLYKPAEIIAGVIKWGGEAILVGAIIWKGIQYVTVSPEGKAEIKKQIVMLTIGAFLLFATTELINIVLDFVRRSGLNSL